MKAAMADPEVRARRSDAISKARIGWCPPQYQAEYRELVKKIGAKDARASIQGQIDRARGKQNVIQLHQPQQTPRADRSDDVLEYLKGESIKITRLRGEAFSHHGKSVSLADLVEMANKIRAKKGLPLIQRGRAA